MFSEYLLKEWHIKMRLRHFSWFLFKKLSTEFLLLMQVYQWFEEMEDIYILESISTWRLADTPLFALHPLLFQLLHPTSLWSRPAHIHSVDSLLPSPSTQTQRRACLGISTPSSTFPLPRLSPPCLAPHISVMGRWLGTDVVFIFP